MKIERICMRPHHFKSRPSGASGRKKAYGPQPLSKKEIRRFIGILESKREHINIRGEFTDEYIKLLAAREGISPEEIKKKLQAGVAQRLEKQSTLKEQMAKKRLNRLEDLPETGRKRIEPFLLKKFNDPITGLWTSGLQLSNDAAIETFVKRNTDEDLLLLLKHLSSRGPKKEAQCTQLFRRMAQRAFR